MKKLTLTLLILAATALGGVSYAAPANDDKAVAAEEKTNKDSEAKKEAEPKKKEAQEGKGEKAKKETKETKDAKADKPKKAGKATPYPLDTCMVTDNKLGSMGDEVTIVYEGKEIKFCCKPCESKFKKDPARYLPKLDK